MSQSKADNNEKNCHIDDITPSQSRCDKGPVGIIARIYESIRASIAGILDEDITAFRTCLYLLLRSRGSIDTQLRRIGRGQSDISQKEE